MDTFNSSFFAGNRQRLIDSVDEDTVVFIPANGLMQSSADLAFPFRQDSSFWYMCGLDVPDAVLVIDSAANKSTLLLPMRSDFHDEWDGAYDAQQYKQRSGLDEIVVDDTTTSIANLASDALSKQAKIGYMQPLDSRVEPYGFYANPARQKVFHTIEQTLKKQQAQADDVLVDMRVSIARLRQIKQQVELDAIQRAIDVTADGLAAAREALPSATNEKDIERILTAHFHMHADGHGYEPIVAAGKNAATIHYHENTAALNTGELLLLDVAALYGKYSADISRTWSIGKPTKRQRQLQAHVLQVQEYAISLLRPGVLLKEYQKQVEEYHNKHGKKLGIDVERYPHGISHFLGLDVHDAGDYSAPLQEGTVLTVEPGVYLSDESVGIRIEDNVVITADGARSLSNHIPADL